MTSLFISSKIFVMLPVSKVTIVIYLLLLIPVAGYRHMVHKIDIFIINYRLRKREVSRRLFYVSNRKVVPICR